MSTVSNEFLAERGGDGGVDMRGNVNDEVACIGILPGPADCAGAGAGTVVNAQ